MNEALSSAELGRRMYEGVRSSDMRYEGAHLLAEYIVQAGKMFAAAEVVIKSNSDFVRQLDEQRAQLEELAALTPSMLNRAETRLAESTARQVTAIDLAGKVLRDEIAASIAELRKEKEELQEARRIVDKQKNEIRLASEKLTRDRKDFNNLPLWQRILGRA